MAATFRYQIHDRVNKKRNTGVFLKISSLVGRDVRTIDTGVSRCIINYISNQPHEDFYFWHYRQPYLFQRNQ